MAHVTPYFDDIRELTYTVGASAVTGGQLVASQTPGDRLVVTAGAGSTAVKGVALYDAASGKKVAVARQQMLPVTTTATVAAGDKLVAGAAGAVTAAGATPDARTIVGEAMESRTGAGTVRAYIY